MPIVTLKEVSAGLPTTLTVRGNPRLGGEAAVYFSVDDRYAVKLYHRPAADRERSLSYVRSLFERLPEDQAQFILPPLALVDRFDGQPRVGFVMRRVPATYAELGEYVVSPVQAARQFRQGRSWADYLRLARAVATCIDVLHRKGCAHSDVHYRNFMVALDTGRAVMLEADAVVVPGFLLPNVKGLMGFMAPEVLTSRVPPSDKTDRHSLAVLLLHTLLFRNVMNPLLDYASEADGSELLGWGERAVFSEHPTDRRHRPSKLGWPLFRRGALSYQVLGPRLGGLTERALIEGLRAPGQRPTAHEWVVALASAVDELYGCGHCRQHFLYPHWQSPAERRACPLCGERCGSPGPVVMDLLEEKQRGTFQTCGRRLVLGADYKLFADVLDPQRVPPPSRRAEPVAAQCAWVARTQRWVLTNHSEAVWTSRLADGSRGPRLGRGESVTLQPGLKLRCGDSSRLLRVVEAPG